MRLKGWFAALLAVGLPWTAPAQTFDHGAFDALLEAHVVNGLVDYDAFAKAPTFPRYLAGLAAFNPATLPRPEQLAFWINAYNAYTIQLINQHGERQSIRNINRTLGFVRAYGPWTEKMATVGGKVYGLDEIEQGIIRPTYQEPRIHFALVCAAMGCPPLRSEAYVGARLEAQLEDQGRVFVTTQPAKNRVDVASRTVYLSPIFLSFRDYIKDFGGSQAAAGRYLARYFPDGAEKTLLQSGSFKARETVYDWTLNSQANGRTREFADLVRGARAHRSAGDLCHDRDGDPRQRPARPEARDARPRGRSPIPVPDRRQSRSTRHASSRLGARR